ncbi:MAG TPA: adenosine kinase [Fibrobacteraceae bacterium]|nr:adenosine kinase [Fibrobacteraceae bacterium]
MEQLLGVGAALVDLVGEVDDAWVAAQNDGKGGMTLVDWPRMKSMLDSFPNPQRVPGGSACNTMRGLARLGAHAAFLGKVGADDLGKVFLDSLTSNGVQSRLLTGSIPTGRVLSAVTPDAQRSMFTYLGASSETTPADLQDQSFLGASHIYLEGYIAYNAPWFKAVVELAHKLQIPLILDFGSFNVIQDCRPLLDWALRETHFAALIANEDEAKAFTGLEGEAALRQMIPLAETVVVKLGRAGALLAHGSEIVRVPAIAVEAVDTTGAGDLWASGFLYGILQGKSLEFAGNLASRVASEVVQVMGPMIPPEGWERILGSQEYRL